MENKTIKITYGLALLLAMGAGGLWSQGNEAGALISAIVSVWFVCFVAGASNRWLGLISSGFFALLVSLYLGVQHKGVSGESICSVSQTFDCDKVNTSEYAKLFDIPIAFLGSSFYAGVIVLAILCFRGGTYKNAAQLIALGGWISIAYSAFLAYASVQIGTWCLFCISLYGLNGLILYFSLSESRGSEGSLIANALGSGSSFNVFAGSAAVMLVGTMAWYSGGTATKAVPVGDTAEDLAALFEQTEGPITLDGSEPVYGSPDAPYMILEFADYECPYCGRLYPEIHALPKADPDIQVLFKHYPLSGLCNDALSPDRHKYACGAARAADCANRQGLFWEYSSQMFKNQKDLDREGLMIMAKMVGLDVEALGACMDDDLTKAKVKKDIEHGEKAGVHATPSIFLKGLYGTEWVAITSGPKGAAKLIAAHKAGKEFPASIPEARPHHH